MIFLIESKKDSQNTHEYLEKNIHLFLLFLMRELSEDSNILYVNDDLNDSLYSNECEDNSLCDEILKNPKEENENLNEFIDICEETKVVFEYENDKTLIQKKTQVLI